MTKIEIIALCPRILSLKKSDITSYLENNLKIVPNNSSYEDLDYKKVEDWLIGETNKLKIKIFTCGIVQIRNNISGHDLNAQLSFLSEIVQDVSVNLFHSEVIFDISINYCMADYENRNRMVMEMMDYISVSSKFNDNILYELKKDDNEYQITIKNIMRAKDLSNIFQSIISN